MKSIYRRLKRALGKDFFTLVTFGIIAGEYATEYTAYKTIEKLIKL